MAAIPPANAIALPVISQVQPVGSIAANAVPTAAQVEQEFQYVRTVKKARDQFGNAVVTAADLGDALVRQHQIVSKRAGGGAAPAWAAQLLADVATLMADVATLTADFATLTATVAANNVSTMARMLNRRLNDDDKPLHVIHKTNAGVPQAVPAFAPPGYAMPPFAAVPAVNDVPATHGIMFPATVADLMGLTKADITSLSVFYNDAFGLVGGSTLAQMRASFARFVGR